MVPVLNSIVDQAQAAFVEGRSIADNVHLVQELLQKYCHKRISPRCILKVDLSKVYDSVNWKLLGRSWNASLLLHIRLWSMEACAGFSKGLRGFSRETLYCLSFLCYAWNIFLER